MNQLAPAAHPLRKNSLELFQHRNVGFGRHIWAVLASSLAQGAAQASVAMFILVVPLATNADRSMFVQTVSGLMFWTALMVGITIVMLVPNCLFMTVARAVLGRKRRNKGAAYVFIGVALGLSLGVATASFYGTPPMIQLIQGAAFGAIGGLVYWRVASGGRDAVSPRDTAALFS
jgi:hypothetical protein